MLGGFIIALKIELLSAQGFKDFANLISVVVDITHDVLAETHKLGLLVDDSFYFLFCTCFESFIDSNKELSKDVNCGKNISVASLINIISELILKLLIFSFQFFDIFFP